MKTLKHEKSLNYKGRVKFLLSEIVMANIYYFRLVKFCYCFIYSKKDCNHFDESTFFISNV